MNFFHDRVFYRLPQMNGYSRSTMQHGKVSQIMDADLCFPCRLRILVTIQQSLSREVLWHEYAKIPRGACKNLIAEGGFYWIFAHTCEGTEQLQILFHRIMQRLF